MKTLIIPCASERKINDMPIFLLHHPNGKIFLEWSMEGIDSMSYDRIIIVVREEDERKYGVVRQINAAFGVKYPMVEILLISEGTNGPADTVYYAIKSKSIHGEIGIKDSINKLIADKENFQNFVTGINLSTWNGDIHDIRRKSFIQLNEQGQILDIIEKQICSENISVGYYGFSDADEFCFAYEQLNDKNYPIQSLYVSHIISYMIGCNNKIFHFITANSFEEWGNEKTWLEVQKRYATYFLDLDKLFGYQFDSDAGKEVMEALQIISKRGGSFVGFTSNDEGMKRKARTLFEKAGINCLQVIYGCSMSTVKAILSDKNEINRCLYEA